MHRKVVNGKIARRLRGKPKRDLTNLKKKKYYLSHISTIIFHAGINYKIGNMRVYFYENFNEIFAQHDT